MWKASIAKQRSCVAGAVSPDQVHGQMVSHEQFSK
jgi:hypothetical protein